MNYAEIESKYPKAFEVFDAWLHNYLQASPLTNAMNTTGFFLLVRDEMQIGVLEKFFDEQGLFFEIYIEGFEWLGSGRQIQWGIRGWNAAMTGSDTRSEAQIAAFTRCFEILERKLP